MSEINYTEVLKELQCVAVQVERGNLAGHEEIAPELYKAGCPKALGGACCESPERIAKGGCWPLFPDLVRIARENVKINSL